MPWVSGTHAHSLPVADTHVHIRKSHARTDCPALARSHTPFSATSHIRSYSPLAQTLQLPPPPPATLSTTCPTLPILCVTSALQVNPPPPPCRHAVTSPFVSVSPFLCLLSACVGGGGVPGGAHGSGVPRGGGGGPASGPTLHRRGGRAAVCRLRPQCAPTGHCPPQPAHEDAGAWGRWFALSLLVPARARLFFVCRAGVQMLGGELRPHELHPPILRAPAPRPPSSSSPHPVVSPLVTQTPRCPA
jgi:hypothetical protein